MPNSFAFSTHARLALCSVSLMLFCAGCAASSATIIDEEVVTNPKPMYSYTSLIIQNLELKRELYTGAPESGMSTREQLYAKLPDELSDTIERNVKTHSIYKNISRSGKPDAETLLLTGKFTRIGRFKVAVIVSLRDGGTGQEVAHFRQTLWDVIDTSKSFSQLGREIADFIDRIQYK